MALQHKLKYRSEIDGLRAVAVLPVILFHAGVSLFQGGFVGVDIFFVISGYLITGIILKDCDEGKFSIVDFYERRFRRILPALFFVLVCIYPVAYMWLMPSEMKAFSQSLVAVSVFSSNILFWLTSGYFDTATELKPLLHTWSLGVEEQYYLFFPLLLLLLYKIKRKNWAVPMMGLLTLFGLAAAQWAVQKYPMAAFYLLPFRAWELMAGGLAAAYLRRYPLKDTADAVSQCGSLAGLAALLIAIFTFDKYMPFPGWNAAVAVIGSVLVIIFTTPKTWVGKILGNAGMVRIGLISYSAYLWHNPLFALARVRSEFEVEPYPLMVGLAVLSLVLADFTWRYVEAPFRDKKRFSRGQIFQISLVGSVAMCAIGLGGHFYFQKQEYKFDYGWDQAARRHTCLIQEDNQDKQDASCYEQGENQVLLWGDSHAASLYQGLSGFAKARGVALTQLTESACPPLLDWTASTRSNCQAINSRIMSEIAANHYDTVILHSMWFMEKSPAEVIQIQTALSNTVQQIKVVSPSSKIVIIGNVPRWYISAERAYEKELERGLISAGQHVYAAAIVLPELEKGLRQVAEQEGALFIAPSQYLCQQTGNAHKPCLLSADGTREKMLYIDADHLSKTGAEILVEDMKAPLETVFGKAAAEGKPSEIAATAAKIKKDMQK
ncbi:acyltransferase family protein [Neisseria perflava]|uniref:acyltransferase family protein n=1 Tax=Neisseria perflava TaxID=33053 RepID=UPI0020A18B7F|nr:acyltransferase family protein [Neisseria perflava]MCP1660895.1 peptidoglycan/LPS O-acetylase OafA/YrhL [Neisseria perflava]